MLRLARLAGPHNIFGTAWHTSNANTRLLVSHNLRASACCMQRVQHGFTHPQQSPEPLPLTGLQPRAKDVIDYWFGEGFAAAPFGHAAKDRQQLWYRGGPAVDAEIKQRFGGDLKALEAGALRDWDKAYEQLAAIILSDQFTRNAYRGTAKMYALDDIALQLTDKLLAHPDFNRMQPIAQTFAFLPLMHAEDVGRHQQLRGLIVQCQEELKGMAGCGKAIEVLEAQLKFADHHTECVRRWGRYPHRNKILGRPSTPEEIAGMADGSIPAW